MSTTSSVKVVEAKLPPGFRFHPRDEELICDYLMRKLTHSELPPFLVEVDLNKSEPWDIPGNHPYSILSCPNSSMHMFSIISFFAVFYLTDEQFLIFLIMSISIGWISASLHASMRYACVCMMYYAR